MQTFIRLRPDNISLSWSPGPELTKEIYDYDYDLEKRKKKPPKPVPFNNCAQNFMSGSVVLSR